MWYDALQNLLLCTTTFGKTFCYVQSHLAKPFVMYNHICKTFCYVQPHLAKPFVMYNHIWQNLLLCTTTFHKTFCYVQPHLAKPFVMYNQPHFTKPFVMYNQPHFKALFKKHGYAVCSYKLADFVLIIPAFATIKAMLVVRSRNKHLSFAFGRFCCLPDFIFLVWSLPKHEGNTKLALQKQSLYLVLIQKDFSGVLLAHPWMSLSLTRKNVVDPY